ncbi:hypothetical protein Acsp02_71050 [Actinoplanes sp. NBRC 103695]|nr:hypothetical protein Acsp02_71050 [Actinoplanes sp. NBRC 103695]
MYAHRRSFERARQELRRIHEGGGQNRASYEVRRDLIRARTPGPEDVVVASAAAALASLKGWALQLYLIALFEAQARRQPGSGVDNTRPLLHRTEQLAAWVDLLPAATRTGQRSAGMRRQLVRALAVLERENLVVLGNPDFRGRYNYFRLLQEAAMPSQGLDAIYTIPRAGETGGIDPAWIRPPGPVSGRSAVVTVPATFFVNGWVHVLSAAEITTYLMLCDLEARYPTAAGEGVYANDPQRRRWYGIHRDVYATHRQLAAYGLVERLDAPARRPDGTIMKRPRQQPLQPYWFRTRPGGFEQASFPRVTSCLDLPTDVHQPTAGEHG